MQAVVGNGKTKQVGKVVVGSGVVVDVDLLYMKSSWEGELGARG